jgi:hypothetical protein
MVLNIVENESRLFITAEKAPYLICVEVFQPQEIQMHIEQQFNQERPRAFEIMSKFQKLNKTKVHLLNKINLQLSKA